MVRITRPGEPQTGVPAGMLIANTSLLIMSAVVSDEAFLSWGWRVPFPASIVLVAAGIVIRLRVAESPVFEQARSAGKVERQPVVAVLRRQPLNHHVRPDLRHGRPRDGPWRPAARRGAALREGEPVSV